jgi:Flp pilus assembly pilin Flp
MSCLEEAWMRLLRAGWERGQDLIEYALFGGVLAAVLITLGVGGLTGGLMDFFGEVRDCVDFDSSSNCGP